MKILDKIKQKFNEWFGPKTVEFYNTELYPNGKEDYLKSRITPTPQQQYNGGFNLNIPSKEGGDKTTDVPSNLSQLIGEVFDPIKQATPSATILHHPQGPTIGSEYYGQNENMGENPGFVTGKGWDDYNYDDSGNVKKITNPFTGTSEHSEDRGLFRINNETFYDLLKRKKKQMEKIGLNSYKDYEQMYDPYKNIQVARLIYDEGGWDRWFAAPADLSSRGDKYAMR